MNAAELPAARSAALVPSSDEPSWPNAAYAWLVAGVLTIAHALSFLDRTIVSMLVEPLERDLGLTDTQVSLLQGLSFAILYTTLALFIAGLADRASRRAIIGIGIFFWSLTTALCSGARTFGQFFLARMGVGFGEAALGPSAMSLLSDYFPPARLARATALYGCGYSIGGGLAIMVSGAVVAWAERQPHYQLPWLGDTRPWQLAFLVIGMFGMGYSLLMLAVKEPQRRGSRPAGGPGEGHEAWLDIRVYLRGEYRFYLWLTLAFTAMTFWAVANTAWIPAFLIRAHGWTIAEVGWRYGTIVLVTATAGNLLGGVLAAYFVRRGRPDANLHACVIGVACTILPAVAYPLMRSSIGALTMLALFNLAYGIPVGGGFAALQEVTPNRMRARVSALFMLTLNVVGLGLGPTAVALLTDYALPAHELRDSLAILNIATIPLTLWLTCAARRAYADYKLHGPSRSLRSEDPPGVGATRCGG